MAANISLLDMVCDAPQALARASFFLAPPEAPTGALPMIADTILFACVVAVISLLIYFVMVGNEMSK